MSTNEPRMMAPSYIVRGDEAIMHATISGVRLYHLQRGGPISIQRAMEMAHNDREQLFAAVYSLPTIDDRQVMQALDVLARNHERLKEVSDDIHAKDMRTVMIVAALLVILCIVFAACLILPRVV